MMTLEEFLQTPQCPKSLSPALQALWYDKQQNWHTAHEIVQNAGDADSAWVHAYLHREEGDISNARYWYGRSGKPESKATLQEEWQQIANTLLAKT